MWLCSRILLFTKSLYGGTIVVGEGGSRLFVFEKIAEKIAEWIDKTGILCYT